MRYYIYTYTCLRAWARMYLTCIGMHIIYRWTNKHRCTVNACIYIYKYKYRISQCWEIQNISWRSSNGKKPHTIANRILSQQEVSLQQGLSLSQRSRHLVLSLTTLPCFFLIISIIAAKLHSATPQVAHLWNIALTRHHFRRGITRWATWGTWNQVRSGASQLTTDMVVYGCHIFLRQGTRRFQELVGLKPIAESKVHNLDALVPVVMPRSHSKKQVSSLVGLPLQMITTSSHWQENFYLARFNLRAATCFGQTSGWRKRNYILNWQRWIANGHTSFSVTCWDEPCKYMQISNTA